MYISPSVASSDLFHLEEEIQFANENFHHIHIDVEDGVAVPNITLGMKVCQKICSSWPDSYRSVHLSVNSPMAYLERIKSCDADIVFIQVSHLSNPKMVLQSYRDAGIPLGLSISNYDLKNNWEQLLDYVQQVLVVTNYIGDPNRTFQPQMLEIALKIAKSSNMRTWIDGNINHEIWQSLNDSNLYAAVMGSAIYRDKMAAVKHFLEEK